MTYRALAAALAVCMVTACAAADMVTRKDGTALRGKIVRDNGAVLLIQTEQGNITVNRTDIDTVLKEIPSKTASDKGPEEKSDAKAKAVAEDVEPEIDDQKMVLFQAFLADIASKEDPGERTALIDNVAAIGDDAAPYLYVALNDTRDKKIRMAVMEVLGRSKSPENMQALSLIMQEMAVQPQDRVLRILFARELSRQPEKANITALARLCRMNDRFISKQVSMALKKLYHNDPRGGVKDALVAEIERTTKEKQGKEGELVTMVKVLADVGDASVLDLLMTLSKSYTQSLRTTSVWSIAKIFPRVAPSLKRLQREEVVKRLVRALRDHSEHVRAEAARSFGDTGEKTVISDLIAMMEDRSAIAKSAAHESLKKIVGADIGNSPQAWQFWWEKEQKKKASPTPQ